MEKKLSNVKPIIFSGPMARAILEGRKTQTRRVLKPQPKVLKNGSWYRPFPVAAPNQWHYALGDHIHGYLTSPYSRGNILWVRESFSTHQDPYHLPPYDYDATIGACWYWADGNPKYGDWVRPKPSIHMPRWASRITLEVTEVRVQRLQEISCADAIAEGIRPAANSQTIDCDTPDPRHEFRDLWNSINAKRGFGWDANPWIVSVTFNVHKVNVDEFLKAREAA